MAHSQVRTLAGNREQPLAPQISAFPIEYDRAGSKESSLGVQKQHLSALSSPMQKVFDLHPSLFQFSA